MAKRTLKIYCTCGGALTLETNSQRAITVVENLWRAEHKGAGHKETDARTAAIARRREETKVLRD